MPLGEGLNSFYPSNLLLTLLLFVILAGKDLELSIDIIQKKDNLWRRHSFGNFAMHISDLTNLSSVQLPLTDLFILTVTKDLELLIDKTLWRSFISPYLRSDFTIHLNLSIIKIMKLETLPTLARLTLPGRS